MPELPEVHTTSTILNKLISNKKIIGVWSDYKSDYYKNKPNIKDPKYFKKFSTEINNKKIVKVYRRAKNVLIDIEGEKTILIHMKMTGHLLYGKYIFDSKKNTWQPEDLKGTLADPFNRFIHFVLIFNDKTHLAFSDMRKFATITLIDDKEALEKKLEKIGPEPLDKNFDYKKMKKCLIKKSNQKIKTALMDHSLIAGIGNIYSDEILWASKINPERKVSSLNEKDFKNLLKNTKLLLSKGIDFGGDSMSDYRNPYGQKGKFQLHHKVYQRKNKKCLRPKCKGIIERKMIGQRSSHFCPICQK
jgi:formamidopyrimidine-DNA glycosylase